MKAIKIFCLLLAGIVTGALSGASADVITVNGQTLTINGAVFSPGATTSNNAFILFTDIPYLPLGAGSTDRVFSVYAINPSPTPVIKINGKSQTVLSIVDCDGAGGSSTGLPIHSGLKKSGLVSTVTGYIKRIYVRADNVSNGDTGVTMDGAQLPDFSGSTLPFTIGNTGELLFINSSTGSDSNDGRSHAQAWATFAPCLGTTVGVKCDRGDVVYTEGTFSQTANAGYSPGQPTIIETGNIANTGAAVSFVNYRGTRPLLTNKLKIFANTSGGGQQDVTLAGFRWTNCGSPSDRDPTQMETAGTRLVDNIVSDCECPYAIMGTDSGTRMKFYGNEIFNVNVGSTSNQNHSIYPGSAGVQDAQDVIFNHIHDNGGGRGIQVYGHTVGDSYTNGRISWNLVENVRCDGIRIGGTDASANPDWLLSITLVGNTARNNNQAGDADFADLRIGDIDATAGHGPSGSFNNNVFNGTNHSLTIYAVKAVTGSNTCYSGTFVNSGGIYFTNGGGNSATYPACVN